MTFPSLIQWKKKRDVLDNSSLTIHWLPSLTQSKVYNKILTNPLIYPFPDKILMSYPLLLFPSESLYLEKVNFFP